MADGDNLILSTIILNFFGNRYSTSNIDLDQCSGIVSDYSIIKSTDTEPLPKKRFFGFILRA